MKDIINEEKKYKLNRPITGVIHKDRIWEQWYNPEVFTMSLPKMNQTDYLFSCNEGYENQVILNNRGLKSITVGQLKKMVDLYSKALKARGLKYGDIVATVSLSTPELVALKYACSKIGVITANLNFNDAAGEVKDSKMYKQLDIINPKMVFVLDILESHVADIFNDKDLKNVEKVILPLSKSTPILNIERLKIELLKLSNSVKGKRINNSETFNRFLGYAINYDKFIETLYEERMPSNIAFTSGTTGDSKAVLLSHDANNALAFQHKMAGLGLERGDKNLALVPPFLAFWDADIIHMAMCLGVENILELALTYENIPIYLKNHLPNYGIWSQYLWDSMLTMKEEDRKLVEQHLKKAVVGGERAEINQINRFAAITGIVQDAGFGSTEMDSCFSVAHPNCNVLGSAGLPLPFNNVRVVENGKDLTYNERGRLLITGPGLMNGYFKRDDLTAQKFIKDEEGIIWYDTGDYGYVDYTGSIVPMDRDFGPIVINSCSLRTADIAEIIKNYSGIKICKVDYYEGVIVCHIVFDNFASKSQNEMLDELLAFINENLEVNLQPHIINVMPDGLPRTAVGKVNYTYLGNLTKEIVEETNYQSEMPRLKIYKNEKVLELTKKI